MGKTVDFLNGQVRKLSIVGVVKDYHYESLKEKIKPQLFSTEAKLPFGKFFIRIRPDNIPQTLKDIEKTYRTLAPYRPFIYDFKDDLNDKNYEAEAKWKQIITFAALLTVFISGIGLFGLTALSAEQRTKEIGIRKVLGASVTQIVELLSKDFLRLVLLAFLLAAPPAWYAVNQWLQNFAYQIDVSGWTFALAGVAALVIAGLTVSFQAIKAAVANPVKSLRTE